MPWAAAAAVVGAGISANSAKNASQTQEASGKKALAEQQREFDLSRGDFAPYKYAGSQALQKLQALLGIQGPAPEAPTRESFTHTVTGNADKGAFYNNADPAHQFALKTLPGFKTKYGKSDKKTSSVFDQAGFDAATQKYNEDLAKYNAYDPLKAGQDVLNNDTVYQSGLKFGEDQGTRAINARALAGGGYDSGATLKALTKFGNDYGSTKAGDVFNRLSGLVGTGQSATSNLASLGANNANAIGNIYTGMGNAQAASQISQGNSFGGALNNLGSQYWLSKLTGGGQRTTTPTSTQSNDVWIS